MKEITQYIRRNRNGQKNAKSGVLYAQMDDDKILKIGYSLCCKVDEFDYAKALAIARGRAEMNCNNLIESPPSIREDIQSFLERVLKYFKDAVGCVTICDQVAAT